MSAKLNHWAELFASTRADTLKERELLPVFVQDFFMSILGYASPADNPANHAIEAEREQIGSLARACNELGQSRYDLQEAVRYRLVTTFAETVDGNLVGTLNN